MSRALKKLKKLRGRGLDEWRVRGAQFLAASAGRYGFSSLVREPSDEVFFKLFNAGSLREKSINAENLLAHFRTRSSPNFFAAFADPQQTIAELRRRFQTGSTDGLLESARRICEGRFSLLGFILSPCRASVRRACIGARLMSWTMI
jgi:hypothetical protein